jgi:hypothetical protein
MSLTCFAIAFSLLAAGAGATPNAGKATSERARIEAYLGSHDVASAAELRGFSMTPEKSLMAIALDARGERLIRARSVAALRLLPSPAVQAFLAQLVRDKAKTADATERLLLRRAAVALGFMAGSDVPDRLALLFDNEDAEVRLDAVLGIAMSRAATAGVALRKQLAVEPAPQVRSQILRQLAVLGEAPAEPDKTPGSKKPTLPPMRGGF